MHVNALYDISDFSISLRQELKDKFSKSDYSFNTLTYARFVTSRIVKVFFPAGTLQLTFSPFRNPNKAVPIGDMIEILRCLISALSGVTTVSII